MEVGGEIQAGSEASCVCFEGGKGVIGIGGGW